MTSLINLTSFKEFVKSGSAGGLLLMLFLIISLGIANSPLGSTFENFLAQEIGYHSEHLHLRYPVLLWINDGLMAIFFLLVGLEIKRELVEGELASFKQAILPVFAAIGGMLVPAGFYALVNSGTPTAPGWGIPMATDIAFAIGIISLLGSRVPVAVKLFLTALAIVDDLGAILVIALFYSTELHLEFLLYAGGIMVLLISFNLFGVKKLIFYLLPGALMWYFVHHSGVHATIAGVLTALTLPTTPDDTESPLEKLEHALTKPVNFFIMPLFALANTNIRLEPDMPEALAHPLGLGIVLGLFLGKPIGITLFSWLSLKLGLSSLPAGIRLRHLLGAGMLGGIGFTMSIFIALLSFDDIDLQAEAKFSILVASVLAGFIGFLFLQQLSKKQ
ncbi:Na+/H+ antiporter NhaA (plasmid) [Adhaeribacter swui]|uniref:Na(+)/H(+) antiporter NhaA n=1 Tax=Adhaeribacter swui TaxID=2086471 RepID=A0A7G7G2E1_9BACT|nr:Na+/H+ antiporter NhaA [Adhaeribacter swui]QNF31325.1 Na+/H+ antiporter NhaA [Adhaeribacter swui]